MYLYIHMYICWCVSFVFNISWSRAVEPNGLFLFPLSLASPGKHHTPTLVASGDRLVYTSFKPRCPMAAASLMGSRPLGPPLRIGLHLGWDCGGRLPWPSVLLPLFFASFEQSLPCSTCCRRESMLLICCETCAAFA